MSRITPHKSDRLLVGISGGLSKQNIASICCAGLKLNSKPAVPSPISAINWLYEVLKVQS
jgi:hypothetical protein